MLIQNECVHNAAMCFGSAGWALKMRRLGGKKSIFLGKMRFVFFVIPPCFHLRVAGYKVVLTFHCPIFPASAFVRDDNVAVFICMQQGMDTGVQIHAAVRAIQVSHELRTFSKLLRAEGRIGFVVPPVCNFGADLQQIIFRVTLGRISAHRAGNGQETAISVRADECMNIPP